MRIALGIESSCDDTAVAIVTEDKKILANKIITQTAEHSPYMGVVPEIASRSHMKAMKGLIDDAIKESGVGLDNISLIASTGGPGLIGGVIVGTMFAKAIASAKGIYYFPVNHLAGHALTARLVGDIQFPYLLLLVSGGHCQYLAVKSANEYQLLGETIDDAAGEAFDKVAKMLGLDFPGGPMVEKRARLGNKNRFNFPMPLCDRTGCDFSFSGLKTSVRNVIMQNPTFDDEFINDICASFQHTVLKILEHKTKEAFRLYEGISDKKDFVIAGGVAANRYLVGNLEEICNKYFYKLHILPIKLCTDNAAMIAWAGLEQTKGKTLLDNMNFCPRARWPLDSRYL
jgi:N6-L-threonylcarbamoyladenine synthase